MLVLCTFATLSNPTLIKQSVTMTPTEMLKTDDFDVLVDAIHSILSRAEVNNMVLFDKHPDPDLEVISTPIDWNISRERVYVIFPLLAFLKQNNQNFPFQRQSPDSDKTIIDAMILALRRFKIFVEYNHDQMLSLYEERKETRHTSGDILGYEFWERLGVKFKQNFRIKLLSILNKILK